MLLLQAMKSLHSSKEAPLFKQGTATIDLRPHFVGFFGQNGKSIIPIFEVDYKDNFFSPSIDGSTMTVKSFTTPCIGYCEVTVNDGETIFTQRFGVAVIGTPHDTYTLTYMVDDKLYKSFEVISGAAITPEVIPTKVGYTFSGWSWIPSVMPAEDVTITGSFTANKYKLTYMLDGE